MRWFALPWAALLIAACGAPAVELNGRPCSTSGECLPGYECDLGICVPVGAGCVLGRPDSCGNCDQDCTVDVENATPVCREIAAGDYDCDYEGPCDANAFDLDGERANGCECAATGDEVCDNVDNDCNGLVDDGLIACQCTGGTPWDHEVCDGVDNDCNGDIDDGPTLPCGPGDVRDCNFNNQGPTSGVEACNELLCAWSGECVEKDLVAPPAVTVTATPQSGAVALSWTHPDVQDLAECVVIRKTGLAPASRSDGEVVHQVNTPAAASPASWTDTNVSNGTVYGYAVYCRDLSGNWQTDATPDTALPMAQPPANPTDLRLGPGDGQIVVEFTAPPSTFTECLLVRKTGSAPTGHADPGNTTLGSYTTESEEVTYTDPGLTNGTLYYYAVFCQTESSWNDNTALGGNLASATPRLPNDCTSADTVTITATPIDCGHYAGSTANALMMALRISTDCDNTLTQLTIHELPASTLDTELSNFSLYIDTDGSGDLTDGVDELIKSASQSGADVTFSGLSEALTATEVGLLVVAGVGTVSSAVFVAWEMDNTDLVLLDSDSTIQGGPLLSSAHTLRTGRCPVSPAASDLGPATFGPVSIESLPANNGTWSSSGGDEATWTPSVGADFTGQTSDCQLTTAGTPSPVYASDAGGSSVVLHIDTGLPLGLPICGLTMRVYATENDGNGCNYDQLTNFSTLYLYYYDGATTVAGETTRSITTTAGPSVNGCNSHYADFDLSGLYTAATAAGGALNRLHVRAVLEEGGGINADNSKATAVPDLFLRINDQ